MKYLWNLAAKNLFRNKLRSFISILAITLSVALVVFVKGLVVGMIDNMFTLHIQYKAGHIKVIDQEYKQKQRLLSLNSPVDGFKGQGLTQMQEELKEIEGVKLVIPRLKFGAMVSQKDKMIRMIGWGVKPSKETEFTNIENKIVEGRMIKKGQLEIIMGTDLLQEIGIKVGDKTTILYKTSFGSLKASTFKVVGRIDSGLKLLDNRLFYLPLNQAQRILGMPNMATEVLLETVNYRHIAPTLAKVNKLFKNKGSSKEYAIIPWDNYSMIGMLKVGEMIYNLIYIFLAMLGGFIVINTMVMIVKERTKEIGMMAALGLKKQEILFMFIIEGIVMGVVGSLAGVIIGGIVTKITALTGIIDYSNALKGVSANIMMNPVIRPAVSSETLIYSFLLGVLVTTVTCIIPARRATKLNPADALRSN